MKTLFVCNIFSLTLFSVICHAAEETPTVSVAEKCEALGYTSDFSECSEDMAVLVCPFNDAVTKRAVCTTNNLCRGYPLFKKDGQFYYIDTYGDERLAKTTKGVSLETYIDGDWETCIAAHAQKAVSDENKLVYYRAPKCTDEALFNGYFCNDGCDVRAYPYLSHPGNFAGKLEKCVTATQTYYGFSKCNTGWHGGFENGGDGRCETSSCSMLTYPYMVEPKRHYGESVDRGNVEICKIGGASYYRYTSCSSGFELIGSVCSRLCALTNCTKESKEMELAGDSGIMTNIEYDEWSCKMSPSCYAGDIVTLDNKKIGVIASVADGEVLLMPMTLTNHFSHWFVGNNVVNINRIYDKDYDTSGKFLTKAILQFKEEQKTADGLYPYTFPPAEYCSTYEGGACPNAAFCGKGQWFFPSYRELYNLYDDKYILSNAVKKNDFYYSNYWDSSEGKPGINIRHTWIDTVRNAYSYNALPMMSFKLK